MDQINCECIYFFDSIYYIVQLIFNFFRFLITCGYDTIHNKKNRLRFVSIYVDRKATIIFTQTIFHCDRIFPIIDSNYNLFNMYICYPLLIFIVFFRVSDVKCRNRKYFFASQNKQN